MKILTATIVVLFIKKLLKNFVFQVPFTMPLNILQAIPKTQSKFVTYTFYLDTKHFNIGRGIRVKVQGEISFLQSNNCLNSAMIILLIIVSSCSGITEVNITRGEQSSLHSAGRTTDKAWDKNMQTDVS